MFYFLISVKFLEIVTQETAGRIARSIFFIPEWFSTFWMPVKFSFGIFCAKKLVCQMIKQLAKNKLMVMGSRRLDGP